MTKLALGDSKLPLCILEFSERFPTHMHDTPLSRIRKDLASYGSYPGLSTKRPFRASGNGVVSPLIETIIVLSYEGWNLRQIPRIAESILGAGDKIVMSAGSGKYS